MEARNIGPSTSADKENFFSSRYRERMEFRTETEDAKRCLGRKNILCQLPLCSSFALV